jgi:hypothetical protein
LTELAVQVAEVEVCVDAARSGVDGGRVKPDGFLRVFLGENDAEIGERAEMAGVAGRIAR